MTALSNSADTPVPNQGDGQIVTLSRDVFFGMRVRTILRQLGMDLILTKDEAATVEAAAGGETILALVDFNQPVDWVTLEPLIASEVPVVAFGSHTDVDGFRAARAAGVNRVVSNGEFSRNLPGLIEKYKA